MIRLVNYNDVQPQSPPPIYLSLFHLSLLVYLSLFSYLSLLFNFSVCLFSLYHSLFLVYLPVSFSLSINLFFISLFIFLTSSLNIFLSSMPLMGKIINKINKYPTELSLNLYFNSSDLKTVDNMMFIKENL